jgi:hypothetical protein
VLDNSKPNADVLLAQARLLATGDDDRHPAVAPPRPSRNEIRRSALAPPVEPTIDSDRRPRPMTDRKTGGRDRAAGRALSVPLASIVYPSHLN